MCRKLLIVFCAENLLSVPSFPFLVVCRNVLIACVPSFHVFRVPKFIVLRVPNYCSVCRISLMLFARRVFFVVPIFDVYVFGHCESMVQKCTRKTNPSDAFNIVCMCAGIRIFESHEWANLYASQTFLIDSEVGDVPCLHIKTILVGIKCYMCVVNLMYLVL